MADGDLRSFSDKADNDKESYGDVDILSLLALHIRAVPFKNEGEGRNGRFLGGQGVNYELFYPMISGSRGGGLVVEFLTQKCTQTIASN